MTPSLLERDKLYYKLDITDNLPPGTDSIEQFELSPRQPRLSPRPKRPVPEWPPEAERKGKWIWRYLDKLDPDTEYDQIIKTAIFFMANSFAFSAGYASTFIHLVQTPAGAAAVHHTAKAYRRGHQRYFETQDYFLDWMWYGSGSDVSRKRLESVNRIHASVWKNVPGAYSHPWEGEMAIIGAAYFETYLRKLVGARRMEPHPNVQRAWPEWGERVCAQLRTEPLDGSRSFGVNFPRTWEEVEGFYLWFQRIPMERYTDDETRRKAHDASEAFIRQFSVMWFPRRLQWFGRQVVLTVIPAPIREHNEIGHPNPITETLIKFAIKVYLDMKDALPDPVRPDFSDEYHAAKGVNWKKTDIQTEAEWTRRDRITDAILLTIVLVSGMWALWQLRIFNI
ncbi:hypothetical protein CGCSCA4_v004233 [Colletotrichum siamense]|uniref:ER-bound oxygenase mpaB/mpaB'/Rubber oxygenase catalytic domain-containing protein n=1 Tax=Colletotrichum siamense TaxID=690259 RepID=A0A9P5K8M5_COLSI|nr:hypothetical protein CGCSCA4_v004233 [Colletotrichum siamense]KAF4863567.1 hypothetical protein CGCSCA2_v002911 [Colletotrichum siamense]